MPLAEDRLLANKTILLGVTGGIAAYKSVDLVRRLKEVKAKVRVAMTPGACEFITPLTFQAVSGNPVHTQLLNPDAEAGMGHIELARWADLVLIAPASADFLAQLAHGLANNLLSTVCLATRAPIAVAPAMNQVMWCHPATQDNVSLLQQRGVTLLGPGHGSQACGEIGAGRMLEPLELIDHCHHLFTEAKVDSVHDSNSSSIKGASTGALTGKKILITAGPTREALDPVRYISNHSSGKMGFAIAEAAQHEGGDVTLIAGPVNLSTPKDCRRVDVISALEMHEVALKLALDADIVIATAAVADYRPCTVANHKIKKSSDNITVTLTKNPDIIADIAKLSIQSKQSKRPFTVGFAAETQDVVNYGQQKRERKNLDMIIANDVSDPNIGFNSEQNAVTIISKKYIRPLKIASKTDIARQIIASIAELANSETRVNTDNNIGDSR